jgi:dTDP-4-dehydrorhamnose 3,5-epimerase
MELHDTPLAGLKRIQLKVHGDKRGFFVERFHADEYRKLGLPTEYAQDNHSRSAPGIIRGLHYQYMPPQGKLVGVVAGKIWDLVVDIRPWSMTFGKYYAEEMTGENGIMLWIPPGFAHGFCVLGDEPADLVYKTTSYYNPQGEGGIRFNDASLGIPWPIRDAIVSERDKQMPGWKDYCANPPHWGENE